MRIAEISSTPVFVAYASQPLAAAAREMRTQDVGALVVVDPRDPQQRPLGIITDRDIVRGQLERSADLYCLTVADVMTRDPLTVAADAGLGEAIRAMSERGVRRAPVVDRSGGLVGVVTMDDVLPAVARELNELAGITVVQARGQRLRAREAE
ncbi:MAG TPA: CBS domain-containing protein [Steroidobacteraceae bacterium]|nr:CBS domain-containing protein [Steroidobacteraceae bacterium]